MSSGLKAATNCVQLSLAQYLIILEIIFSQIRSSHTQCLPCNQALCTRYWDAVITIQIWSLLSCSLYSGHVSTSLPIIYQNTLGEFPLTPLNGLASNSNKIGNLVIVPLGSHAYLAFSIPQRKVCFFLKCVLC